MAEDEAVGTKEMKVHSTPRSSHRLPPPVGLSTDAMLRLGSSILGLAPQRTMSLAEDLYTHGYLSYPRTQTTRYPDDFDIGGTLSLLSDQPNKWGALAAWLSLQPPLPPKHGIDFEDHPPIHPVAVASPKDIKGGGMAWRLYEAVCQHFIASLMPDAFYEERKLVASMYNTTSGLHHDFATTWHRVTEHGWLHAQPWRASELGLILDVSSEIDDMRVGEVIKQVVVRIEQGRTRIPHPLRESELLTLLHGYKVGTEDYTMAQHITTIVEHGYVEVHNELGKRIGDVGAADVGTGGAAGSEAGEKPGQGGDEEANEDGEIRAAAEAAAAVANIAGAKGEDPARPNSPRAQMQKQMAAGNKSPQGDDNVSVHSKSEKAMSVSLSRTSRSSFMDPTKAKEKIVRKSEKEKRPDYIPPPKPPPPRPPGRYLVPTPLGRALCAGLTAADPSLVDPNVRQHMEEMFVRISKNRSQPAQPGVEDYFQLAHEVVRQIIEEWTGKFDVLKKSLKEAFEPHFGQVLTERGHETVKGEDILITREMITATWSNGGPMEWRSKPVPQLDEVRELVRMDETDALSSPQKMFIKGLFSPAGLIRPAKGAEMVVGFEEGEKYKKEVLEDPNRPPPKALMQDPEAYGTATALKILRNDRSVSPGVYERIVSAAQMRTAKSPTAKKDPAFTAAGIPSPRASSPSPFASKSFGPTVNLGGVEIEGEEEEEKARPPIDKFLKDLAEARAQPNIPPAPAVPIIMSLGGQAQAPAPADAMSVSQKGSQKSNASMTSSQRGRRNDREATIRERNALENKHNRHRDLETHRMLSEWKDDFQKDAALAFANEASRKTDDEMRFASRPKEVEMELERAGAMTPRLNLPVSPSQQAGGSPATPRMMYGGPTTPRGGGGSTTPRGSSSPMRPKIRV